MKALVIFFISFFLSTTQSAFDQMDKINKSLLQAVRDRNIGKATELLKLGANVNYQNEQLDSPFLLSGALGYTEFVQLFLDNGARFDVFNRYNGTALIPACERGHIETVRLLANTKGFPINHVNRLGWTALMEAVVLGDGSSKYVTIVEILVAAGCDRSIPDKNGVTALKHARNSGYKEIVRILER
jgi:hypothetical protein